MHSDTPTASEYFPLGQWIHADVPVMFLYFPDAQAIQTLPSGPEDPVLHLQLVTNRSPLDNEPEFFGHTKQFATLVEPCTIKEYVAAEQLVHSALPDVFVYFPVGHCKHDKSLFGFLYDPTGQAKHPRSYLP
jgi:hypothetical protein